MHLCVKLGDVASDLLLGFDFRLAGEHFAALDALLVKIPDDALPAAVCAAEYIAVGGQSLFRHFAAPFLNHQQYSRGGGNVQTNVVNRAEKNRAGFWWFYTCRWAKPSSLFTPPQIFALLTNCAQERDYAVWNGREQEKRRRLASEGSSYHPF